ncbi:MAG: hypothetical protein ACI9W2_003282 [Gammaproteobacteria bacterium]|jgi:hypothetical protein
MLGWNRRYWWILKGAARVAVAVGLLAGGLAGCEEALEVVVPPPAYDTIAEPAKALAAQNALNGDTQINLNQVVVVRLEIAGKVVDATSLAVTQLGKATASDGQPALTLIRLMNNHETLSVFTRDPKTGHGYRMDLTKSEWKPNARWSFPVLNAEGEAQVQEIQFLEVFQR